MAGRMRLADAQDRSAVAKASPVGDAAGLLPSEAEIKALVGHRFPGGEYTVAHWENFLLTECAGATLAPGGVVHPIVLFHLPILGAGTSIAEMFALGQADSDASIGIESYDWEMFGDLREAIPYKVSGGVVAAERRTGRDDRPFDRIQFQFEVAEPGEALVARSTITWRYRRGPRA